MKSLSGQTAFFACAAAASHTDRELRRRVAVRLGVDQLVRPQHAAGTGLVVDDDLPANALPALSAIDRITTSVEPPAGQGQIKRMGLAGSAPCACAQPGKADKAAVASVLCTKSRRVGWHNDMGSILCSGSLGSCD